MGVCNLTVCILKQVGPVTVKNPGSPTGQRGRVLVCIHAETACLDANNADCVIEKGMEQSHRV